MSHKRLSSCRRNRRKPTIETCEPRILLAIAKARLTQSQMQVAAIGLAASARSSELLELPGVAGQTVEATFTLSARLAKYRSEVGLYRVDDSRGRIGNLSPGQRGYALAALERHTVLFLPRQQRGAVTQIELAGGGFYGTYLIQNSTSERFLKLGSRGHAPQAFFSFQQANSEKTRHVLQSLTGVLFFEDLTGGGDRDFNDVIVSPAYHIKPLPTRETPVDTTPPEVMISAPTDGLLTVHDVTVIGQASDNGTGVDTVAMRLVSPGISTRSLNYTPIPFDAATSTFQNPLGLKLDGSADGAYTLFVHATDKAGNTSSDKSVGFTLDTTAPTVSITAPMDGLQTNQNVTISGVAHDVVSGVKTLSAHVDSGADFIVSFDASGHFSLTTSLPLDHSADGLHTVTFMATDAAGIPSTPARFTFTLDTMAPTVVVTSPSPGLVRGNSATLAGTVSDVLTGVSTFQASMDGGAPVDVPFDGSGNWTYTLPVTTDGPHAVQFDATDFVGNHSVPVDESFTRDATSPVVTIVAPTGAPLTRTDPVVTGTVTDTGSGVKRLQAASDGGPYVNVPFAAGSWSFTPVATSDGSHSVVFVATDNAGNLSDPVTFSYVLDATEPTVTLSSPVADLLTNAAVTVSGRATDNLSGVATVEAQVDSSAYTSISFDGSGQFSLPLNLPLDGSADGPHTVRIRATDQAGNVSIPMSVTFTLDATAPMIVITSPAQDQTGRTDVTVLGRVTDNLSGVDTLKAHIDNGADILVDFDVSGNYSFMTSMPSDGSADGPHVVHLQATDKTGNVSSVADLAFTLDTTPPRIVIAEPSGSPLTNQNLLVTGVVTDDLSGVQVLQARMDDGPFVDVAFDGSGDFTFTTTLPLDQSADGPHSVEFQATDQVGNVSGLTVVGFTLDTTAPGVTLALDTASDTDPVGDDQTTDSVVNLVGQTEPNLPVTLVETGATTTADASGQYTFAGVALALGANLFHVQATDAAGNVGTASRTFTQTEAVCAFNDLTGWTIDEQGGSPSGQGSVAVAGDRVVMQEGDSFHVALETTFVIPAGATSLSFDYADLSFDTSSVGTIKDAFEASLLDSSGQPLVHTIGTGRDAFFNISEGTTPALGSEASLSDQTVTLNLSGVFAGTTATLVLRLVNNDTDQDTSVAITCVMLPEGIQSAPSISVQGSNEYVPPVGVANATASSVLTEISELGVNPTTDQGALQSTSTSLPIHAALFATTNYYDASSDNKIYRFDVTAGGTPTLQQGFSDPSLDSAYGLAVSPSGELFVSNRGELTPQSNPSVSRFVDITSDLKANGSIPKVNFTSPFGVVFRGDELFVADNVLAGFNNGIAYNSIHRFLFGTNGNAVANGSIEDTSQLGDRGLAISPWGELFVSQAGGDPINKTILRYTFDSAGNAIPNGEISGGGLDNPHDLVFSPWGELFVANGTGASISRFAFTSSHDAVPNGVIPTPSIQPVGLAFSPWGELYTANVLGNPLTIYRWSFDATHNAVPSGSFVSPAPISDLLFYVPQAPTLTISDPADGSSVPDGTVVLVTGTASAPVSVDGKPVDSMDPAGHFFSRLTVAPGRHTYTFSATDAFGQTTVTSLTLDGVTNATSSIDFSLFSDVSASFQGDYSRTSFNEATRTLYADARVQNTGQYPADAPLIVGVKNISDPTVRVIGFDGVLPDGTPYYDFTKVMAGTTLAPGGTTDYQSLQFLDPNRYQFTYDLVFLGKLNHAPAITSVPVVEALAGGSYHYDATATDADHDPLTFSLPVHPAGMVVDPVSGAITWSPTTADIGTHSVTLRVEDGRGGYTEQRYIVSAITPPPNRPPVFTSVPVVDATVNTAYTYAAAATDPDNDPLTFSLVTNPAGMGIDPATGLVSWTPLSGQVGTQNVTLAVADGHGGTASQSYVILLQQQAGNHAPVIISTPITTLDVSTGVELQATIRDFNDTHPDFEKGVSGLVTGLVAPILGADDTPVFVGPNGRGAITSTDTFWQWYHDVSGVNLKTSYSLTLEESPTGSGILTFSDGAFFPIDGQLFGNQGRSHNYHFTMEVHTSFTYHGGEQFAFTGDDDVWVYINKHLAVDLGGVHGAVSGSVNVDTLGLTVGQIYSFDLFFNERHTSSSTFAMQTGLPLRSSEQYAYAVTAFDPDADTITYSLVENSEGMTINPQSGAISWFPSLAQVGPNPITVRVDDGHGGFDTQSFTIDVRSDAPAVIRGTNFNDLNSNGLRDTGSFSPEPTLAGWTMYLDANQNGHLDPDERSTTTDSDGNYAFTNLAAETYIVREVSQPGWALTTPSTGFLSVTVAAGQIATDNDFGNQQANGPPPANRPPVFTSMPPTIATTGQLLRYNATAFDLDNDPLIYDLVVKPAGMVVDPSTGIVVWTPGANQGGVQQVILRVQDGQGGVDLQSFTIAVARPNTSPDITSTPKGPAVVGTPWVYQVTAQDAEADPITFALGAHPAGMTIDLDTGLVTWTALVSQVGSPPVEITASDNQGASTTQSFDLPTVATATDDPPTIASTPRGSIKLGGTYRYQVVATDPNGDPLTYSLVTQPTGMAIDPKTGLIVWTPVAGQVGPNSVDVQVSDGRGGIVGQQFTIQVLTTAVNHAPNIVSNPPQAATIGRLYSYDLTGTDPENDPLVWSLDTAPAGMSIDPAHGTLRWTPTTDEIGLQNVVVRVEDGQGGYATQTYSINTRSVNLPPNVTSTPPTTASVANLYQYAVVAKDPENDPLTFRLTTAPTNMTIDPNTGLISWTPGGSQLGPQDVAIAVDDGQGGTGTQTYTVVVSQTAASSPPVITSTPSQVATVGTLYQYAVTATDPQNESLTFQLLANPAGMTIDPTTGLVSWTPTVAQVGNPTVIVAAVDSSAGGTQTFTINTRAANQPPTINPIADQTVTASLTFRLDVTATDPNNDPLTFTLDTRPIGMTIDALGRIAWSTGSGDLGTHPVTVTVDDGRGGVVHQSFNVVVQPDTEAPRVSLIVNPNPVYLGSPVTIIATATDNVGVVSKGLTVNGVAVPLDAQGRVTVLNLPGGSYVVIASATDAAGNVGTSTRTLTIIDNSDQNPPDVAITTPADGDTISHVVDVIGTASDANLVSYTLSVAPVGSPDSAFVTIASGTHSVTNGVLGQFDPSGLANDSYDLRLQATDAGHNISTLDATVDVASDLKLGNFTLSFVDLTVPVSGIPITLARTYDSLNAGSDGEFGYGWRLEFRDTNLRTSVPAPTPDEADAGVFSPYQDKTHIYITLPGGKREGFTFKAQPRGGFASYLGFADPTFIPDKGVTDSLSAAGATLIQAGDGGYYSVNGLAYNPADALNFGGVFTLTTKDGLAYTIDANSGLLNKVSDTNGNTLTFTNASITSSAGPRITFTRDLQGRIVSATDPSGNSVLYQYHNGDLVAVTDRDKNTTTFVYAAPGRPHFLTEVKDPLGRTGVRTEYDAQGRLSTLFDAAGNPVRISYDDAANIETVKDALGNPTTYVYDDFGNVVEQIDALGGQTSYTYDANNNLLTETDPNGRTTTNTYDSYNNLLTTTDSLGNVTRNTYATSVPGFFARISGAKPVSYLASTTDPLGNTSTNSYDGAGNLTSTTDVARNVTKYAYDAAGNQTSITDANGETTLFTYDAAGHLMTQVDALGHSTMYTYDSTGNQLTQTTTVNGQTLTTTTTYDASGHSTSFTDALGNTTRTEYDALGRKVATTDALDHRTIFVYDDRGQLVETDFADGTKTTTTYDADGHRIASTDRAGRTTKFVYDALGRLTTTIEPDATPATDADNPLTTTAYDAAGQVLSQTDELGNTTAFQYDADGRQTVVTDALGDVYTTTYDTAGRRTATTDALGHTTSFIYDTLGRLTSTQYADGTTTLTTYDVLGRAIVQTDQLGRSTDFVYDDLGRLTAVKDALGQTTSYAYDEAGDLTTQTDANGHVTHYEYDGLGRRTATVLPMGQRSTTTYDAAGNVSTTTDFNGATITYHYDTNNRLASEDFPDSSTTSFTYTPTGQRQSVTDSRGTTSYSYDVRDRLLSRTDPDGTTISYTYDAAGNRTSVTIPSGTTTYTFDALGRTHTVTDPENGVTTYTYDGVGNLIATTLPNGTSETRQYDQVNHLTYLENDGPSGVISSYRYTLAPTGRRDAVVEDTGRRVDYQYDLLDRLIDESISDPSAGNRDIQYTYDPVGNRLTRDDSAEGLTVYSYDPNDRLLTETLASSVTQYDYDANGNTTSKFTSAVDQAIYEWDAQNRLIGASVTDASGTKDIAYRYDVDGLRVASIVDGDETRFLLDTNLPYAQVLEEYTPGGVIVVSYVYGSDLISENRSSAKSFYAVDGLGSTRALSDASGAVTDRYVYDAFGRTIGQIGTTDNVYLFAGEQRDGNVGLDYLRARYLSVGAGRFYGHDSYKGKLYLPSTLHRFSYVSSNPVNASDPSGAITLIDAIADVLFADNMNRYYEGNLALQKTRILQRDLCIFTVSTGQFRCFDGNGVEIISTHAYSGVLGPAQNNPDLESWPYNGPIPRGYWSIGEPIDDPGHRFWLPVNPLATTETFGRDDFYIHGDAVDPALQGTASVGCIILNLVYRSRIQEAGVTSLLVNTTALSLSP